ncbi:MAG: hypothetical protein V7637_1953 [Mycobacteriales bacterium]
MAPEARSARTLLAVVTGVARRHPERVAVRDTARDVTYGELLGLVRTLAGSLGDCRGERIGVCAHRSVDAIVAQLATWTAGGICVPLDPEYPLGRLRSMIDIARVGTVLTGDGLAPRLGPTGVTCLPVAGGSGSHPRGAAGAADSDPAVVFFTSGTTGRPKAVLVPHAGLWNRIVWGIRFHRLDGRDRVLWKAPFSFDASLGEIYSALGAGGTVVVAPAGSERDPAEICAAITANGVTVVHSVPPMLRALADEPSFGACRSLRHVWSGGQILYERDARRLLARLPARLTNQYGPTEASVNATAGVDELTGDDSRPMSVGRAIDGMRAYVLDADLGEVPVGRVGELCLGGVGLAYGYAGDARATAAAFVPDHLSGAVGARLYRTGDLARRTSGDAVTIVGRVDDQVKIRGYRVEPEEVAATLAAHPGVAGAAGAGRSRTGGDTTLVAFVVAIPERRQAFRGYPRVACGDRLAPASLNEHETRFLFEDIFVRNAYLRHGLALADGDTVVDVGANVGMFMLFAHSRARLDRYVAFEPNPRAADVFRANAELHGTRAELHELAVGAGDGDAELRSYDEFSYLSGLHANPARDRALVASFLERASTRDSRVAESLDELRELAADRLTAHSRTVRVRALSGLLAEHQIDRVHLLKINVERSELAVLAGVDPVDWRRVRQVALELEDVDGALGRATELLRRHGFHVGVEEDWSVGRDQSIHYVYARAAGTRPRPASPRQLGAMPLTTADIREFLEQRLPAFMVPAEIHLVDELPTTPGGKTDVAALLGDRPEPPPPEPPEPPALSPTERRVAAIWSDVLGRDRLRANDDIFELGAHSVTVAQVVARIRAGFGLRIPLKVVFQERTLAALAAAIDRAVAEQERASTTAADGVAAAPAPAAAAAAPAGAASAEFAATAGQRALWWLNQVDRGRADYNDYHVLELTGVLDRARLARSLSEAAGRQTMLRSALRYRNGQVTNTPADDVRVGLRRLDLSGLDDGAADRAVRDIVNEPFDVARPPLLRAALIARGPDRHLLVLVAHHAVCDEWSWRVLWNDTCTRYAGGALTGPDDAYRQFAALERHRVEHQLSDGLRFWAERLRGVEPARWRAPASPVPRSDGSGVRLHAVVRRPELDAMRAVATACGATAFMPFFAAYAWLLGAVTTARSPVIGVPVSLRERVEFEGSVGYYVNMNAMRSDGAGDPTFLEQVRRTRVDIIEADSYRWVPFERVVQAVNPARAGTGNPLFQAAIVLHDDKDLSRPVGAGLASTERRWHNGTSKFDLTLEVGLRDDRAECGFEYACNVFDDPGARRLAGMFTDLVAGCGADPGIRLSEAVDRLHAAAVPARGRR